MQNQTSGFQLSARAAQLYERHNVPMTTGPLAALMFQHVPLYEGDRVLDVACGTGIVARLAAERVGQAGQVVGVDLNPAMLDVARANPLVDGAAIEWRQGDARALPVADSSFDVVLCQQGLQYVPDKLAALRDMRRVLAPGGHLAFTVWREMTPYNAALADALARHVSADAAARCQSPSSWSNAEHIENLVRKAKFRDLDMQELVITVRRPLSPASVVAYIDRSQFAEDVAAVSEEARATVAQEVCAALQPYRDGDDCVYRQKAHLAQAWTGGRWARYWRQAKTAWTNGFIAMPS